MTAPVWGCPWHGLVRDGQMPLPNGQYTGYPQPEPTMDNGRAMPDTYGIAHRVAVPGVPAPSRSAEEQAVDAAAGRQWRNTAVLAGARHALHGTPLDGWIYVDPDGVRWLVRCPAVVETTLFQTSAPLTFSVTLTRFGELGGAAESHEYQVSSGWGLGSMDGSVGSGRIMLDAIHPAGSAAMIMLHARSYPTGARIMRRNALSFIELTISGPGAAATVALSVARTWDQINQVSPAPVTIQAGWYGNFAEGDGSRTSRKTLAVWYGEDGAHIDVEFRVVADYVYAIPEYLGGGAELSRYSQASAEIQLAVGGEVLDAISASFYLHQDLVDGGTGTQIRHSYEVTIDGVTMSSSATAHFNGYPGYPGIDRLGCVPGDDRELFGAPDWISVIADDFGFGGYFYGSISPYPYSRQVIGFEIMTNDGSYGSAPRNWKRRPPVTPSGLATGTTGTATTTNPSQYYGSWDPHSGACSWRQLSPVCYV